MYSRHCVVRGRLRCICFLHVQTVVGTTCEYRFKLQHTPTSKNLMLDELGLLLVWCLSRDDVAVNPNDTEESIWAFLCEAQLDGPEAARQRMLQVH